MIRTTDDDIRAVIEVDSVVAPTLISFIRPASMLVDEVCDTEDNDYSVERLKEIETWLAAHFYAQRDPRLTSEGVSSLQQSFQSRVDLGFDNTHYGQMAMRLDTGGGLAAINAQSKSTAGGTTGPKIATAYWMGTEYDDYGNKVST